MATREFRLPDLGEGLTESEVVEWRVAVGDAVELNQVIAEVETAKALVELPSPVAGVVRVLHAEEGQTVEVGEPLVTFDLSGAAERSGPADGMPGAGPDSSAADEGPEPNLVGYGARPERTGRPARRRRREVLAPEPTAAPAAAAVPPNGTASAPATSGGRGERPRSTPVVRAVARQRGLDLTTVVGSGPHGRITRDDVEAASAPAAPAAARPAP
ncbi:biotin/lipoyl-containing protein, partial [Isoptericola sp. NPDC057559]|uniref:biotin/lipoyl-containing protein n=1 Tax=Isoptericola sp. NPDC057559 TaxID=3346168 RepID=UPI00368F5069